MFRVGDWVEVRSKNEILETLDKKGQLDGMPFMPQMFEYCGRRFRVYKRAHKTCDTISGDYRGRRVPDGVHLDLRCDGKAYGGCQAGCLIFWKQAWLKPILLKEKLGSAVSPLIPEVRRNTELVKHGCCTEADVRKGTRAHDQQALHEMRYVCQATEVLYFTAPLYWWDVRQYFEDYRSGNATLGKLISGFVYVCYYYGTLAPKRIGRPSRWLYNRFQALWGGSPFPKERGTIPMGQPTPESTLNLQAGELVRIKSYKEILATLNTARRNRGLGFEQHLVPYCGGIYRVRARVSNFIDEATGKMKTLKTPAVILEGVFCQACYANYRMFCPRSVLHWWREIWLERISESPAEGGSECPETPARHHLDVMKV